MSRSSRVLLALSLGLLLITTLAPAAQAAGEQGIQGGWAIDDAGGLGFAHGVQRQLPLMEAAGAGWVRINFRLGAAYRDWTKKGRNGRTALQQYERLVDDARSRGLKVLGLLSNETWRGSQRDWTAGNAEHGQGSGDNKYLQKFSKKAALVIIKRLRSKVQVWEIWNEPNAWTENPSAGVYQGGSFLYPSNFAWLLRHVYEDTRAAGLSNLTFVSGGVFGHDLNGAAMPDRGRLIRKRGDYRAGDGRSAPVAAAAVRPSGADYLTATYQQGRAKAGWDGVKTRFGSYPLDAIGQHFYVDLDVRTSESKIRAYLDDLRAGYAAFEGAATAKQTIVTEFGWTTSFVSEAVQADNLRTAYAAVKAAPFVRNAYWFSIQDVPEAGLFYGLQSGGDPPEYLGQPKPAFQAYREIAGQ